MTTTAELCERAVSGWEKAQDFLINEFAPIMVMTSFIYGDMTEKKRKAFEKRNPEQIKYIKGLIAKGGEIYFSRTGQKCSNCKKDITSEDKFCSNCGTEIK